MAETSMSRLCGSVWTSKRNHSSSAFIDLQPADLFDDRLPINTAAPQRKGEVVQHWSELIFCFLGDFFLVILEVSDH